VSAVGEGGASPAEASSTAAMRANGGTRGC
jgi:hypothetical protein